MKNIKVNWTSKDTVALTKAVAETHGAEFFQEDNEGKGRYYFEGGTSVPSVVGFCLGYILNKIQEDKGI